MWAVFRPPASGGKTRLHPECRGSDYEKRIKAAYPIHPELFDRLYGDWSTLVKFQRTRGVLRLMAAVIHSLWEKGDRNPLILPANIAIDERRVQFELTRYLADNWTPVIETDIDGPGAATCLYQDGPRYWYSTQPTVTRLAEDRAEQMQRDPDRVARELAKRLRRELDERGLFRRVHPLPQSGQDMPRACSRQGYHSNGFCFSGPRACRGGLRWVYPSKNRFDWRRHDTHSPF